MNQGVGGVSEFIRVSCERLTDCRWQNWRIMSKLATDLACTESLIAFRTVPKTYITMNIDRHLKCFMTKLILGVS